MACPLAMVAAETRTGDLAEKGVPKRSRRDETDTAKARLWQMSLRKRSGSEK